MPCHGRLPDQYDRAGEAFCDAGGLPGLSGGAPMDPRVCLPLLRIGQGMEDGERSDPLRRLPPSAVHYRRYGVSRHAHATSDVVPGDVAHLREQERDERPEPATVAWTEELQYGMALPAQAAPFHGETGTGEAFRYRGSGRDVCGRTEGGEARARRVRQADRFRRSGSAWPQDRQNQAISYSRCVENHAGTSRYGSCDKRLDRSDGRVAGLQQRRTRRLQARGGFGDRERTGGYWAAQVPSRHQPAEAMDSRHSAGQRWRRAPSGLFERVHVQVQPAKLKEPWATILQTGATGGLHRTQPAINNRPSTRCCGRLSQLHSQLLRFLVKPACHRAFWLGAVQRPCPLRWISSRTE